MDGFFLFQGSRRHKRETEFQVLVGEYGAGRFGAGAPAVVPADTGGGPVDADFREIPVGNIA
jgi:hypothetical protein